MLALCRTWQPPQRVFRHITHKNSTLAAANNPSALTVDGKKLLHKSGKFEINKGFTHTIYL